MIRPYLLPPEKQKSRCPHQAARAKRLLSYAHFYCLFWRYMSPKLRYTARASRRPCLFFFRPAPLRRCSTCATACPPPSNRKRPCTAPLDSLNYSYRKQFLMSYFSGSRNHRSGNPNPPPIHLPTQTRYPTYPTLSKGEQKTNTFCRSA